MAAVPETLRRRAPRGAGAKGTRAAACCRAAALHGPQDRIRWWAGVPWLGRRQARSKADSYKKQGRKKQDSARGAPLHSQERRPQAVARAPSLATQRRTPPPPAAILERGAASHRGDARGARGVAKTARLERARCGLHCAGRPAAPRVGQGPKRGRGPVPPHAWHRILRRQRLERPGAGAAGRPAGRAGGRVGGSAR